MYNHIQNPKSVAIFCTSLKLGQEPFTSPYYWEAYVDMLLALKDRGIEAYFTTDNGSYRGNGEFSTAYTTEIKLDSPAGLKRVDNVKVDLVFDRAEHDAFAGVDVPVINNAALRQIANNKIAMFENFASLQPESAIANNDDELENAINSMDGDKAVVKEPEGSGGRAVYIGEKSDVFTQSPKDRYPLLIQEFLDTSMGVPGHAPGVHDIRTAVCGGNIISFYIRQAKSGNLHSNVSQGGTMLFLPVTEIPGEVREMVKEIDGKFADTPRYYAADFVYSDKGWKMIELNPYLALLPAADGTEAIHTLNRLADYLVSVCVGSPVEAN